MSLSDAFKNHPDLIEAGTAFQDYLKDSGVSADIDVLTRHDSYPLLQIKPNGSPIQTIHEALREQGDCASDMFAIFNLQSCMCRHRDTLVLTGSAAIVTAIARELTKVAKPFPA